jgi:hypothetical protein
MNSQSERILDWLSHQPIDPLTALTKFGCMRLAARINDLRNAGHMIVTTTKELPNGKKVAQYAMLRRMYD